MNVCLVIPPYVRAGHFYDFPLNYAYVNGACRAFGITPAIINCNELLTHCTEHELLMEVVAHCLDADVVMIGGLCTHYRVVRAIVEYLSDKIVILGGGLVTADPKFICESIIPTYGVAGEGEITIMELLRYIKNGEKGVPPKNVWYRQGSVWRTTSPVRPPEKDLDALPDACYEGIATEEYLNNQVSNDIYFNLFQEHPRCLPVVASRGCRYNCSFCYHPLGRGYRQRNLRAVIAEATGLVRDYGVNVLGVLDEMFSSDKERLLTFCRMMRDLNIQWFCQMRTPDITEDVVVALKESGCTSLSLGVESMSNHMLKAMKKYATRQQHERAFKLCWKHGIGIQGNCLFGFPEETDESIRETVEWLCDNPQYGLNATQVLPLPDSVLFRHALKHGFITDKEAYYMAGCPAVPMNMAISEKTAVWASKKLGEYQKLLPEATGVAATQPHVHPYRKSTCYEVSFQCPHCGGHSAYGDYQVFPKSVKQIIGCRHCKARLNFPLEVVNEGSDSVAVDN